MKTINDVLLILDFRIDNLEKTVKTMSMASHVWDEYDNRLDELNSLREYIKENLDKENKS